CIATFITSATCRRELVHLRHATASKSRPNRRLRAREAKGQVATHNRHPRTRSEHERCVILFVALHKPSFTATERDIYVHINSHLASFTVPVRTHIVVDTDSVKNWRIPIEAQLTWPRLMQRHTVHFPLTAVGNFSVGLGRGASVRIDLMHAVE